MTMPQRHAKPKFPDASAMQAAIDALRPFAEAAKVAEKWPHNSAAGSLIEAMERMESRLRSRPDHPGHDDWKAERARPIGAAHRR